MTLQEATRIAGVELGYSREVSDAATNYADANVPGSVGITRAKIIPPELERAVIEHIKTTISELLADQEKLDGIMGEIKKRAERN